MSKNLIFTLKKQKKDAFRLKKEQQQAKKAYIQSFSAAKACFSAIFFLSPIRIINHHSG